MFHSCGIHLYGLLGCEVSLWEWECILANSYTGIPAKRKILCLGLCPKPQLKSVDRQSWGHRWDECFYFYFIQPNPTLCSLWVSWMCTFIMAVTNCCTGAEVFHMEACITASLVYSGLLF